VHPVSLDEIRTEVLSRVGDLEDGDSLGPLTAALIDLAVHVSVVTLDPAGADRCIGMALDQGATGLQVQEVIVLVSALGVHSLMEGCPRLIRHLARRDPDVSAAPLDAHRQALRRRYIGDDPYWTAMEREMPGFLDSLLRLSPEAFEGFFQYCSLPWKSGALGSLTKELIAFACDATGSHRFVPGLRLHMDNAVKLGAGRRAILAALDIAAAAPAHGGVRGV
jgi:alkylhydroperoxidase/carboxymuconolactone decarboxylase family protein YurZ